MILYNVVTFFKTREHHVYLHFHRMFRPNLHLMNKCLWKKFVNNLDPPFDQQNDVDNIFLLISKL